MKFIFYIVSLIPISIVSNILSSISKTGIYKLSNGYKVTFQNLKMSYKNLNHTELEKLALQSFIETLVSGYETIQSWSRPIHISGKKIFRVENNFLLNKYINDGNGVADHVLTLLKPTHHHIPMNRHLLPVEQDYQQLTENRLFLDDE